MEFATLNTGAKIPLEGFGVYQIPDHKVCEHSVYDAVKTGYRLTPCRFRRSETP